MQQMRWLFVLFASLAVASCAPAKGSVVLSNATSEPISRAAILVCGQTIERNRLQPHDKMSGSFKVNCEGDYEVSVQFESGRRLRSTVGYVSSGIDIASQIIVQDARIVLDADNTQVR
jgi:hypothetical protein